MTAFLFAGGRVARPDELGSVVGVAFAEFAGGRVARPDESKAGVGEAAPESDGERVARPDESNGGAVVVSDWTMTEIFPQANENAVRNKMSKTSRN